MQLENYENSGLNNTKNYYQINFDNEEIISEGYITNEEIIIPKNDINLKEYNKININVYTIKNKEEIKHIEDPVKIFLTTNAILEKQNVEECIKKELSNKENITCLNFVNINYINSRTINFFPNEYSNQIKNYENSSYKEQKKLLKKEIEKYENQVKLENDFYLSVGISQEIIDSFLEVNSYKDYYPFNQISENKKQLEEYASKYSSAKIMELEEKARDKNIDLTEYENMKAAQTTIDNIKYLEEKLK